MELGVQNLQPDVQEMQLEAEPCSGQDGVIAEHREASQPGSVQLAVGCNSDLTWEGWIAVHQAD